MISDNKNKFWELFSENEEHSLMVTHWSVGFVFGNDNLIILILDRIYVLMFKYLPRLALAIIIVWLAKSLLAEEAGVLFTICIVFVLIIDKLPLGIHTVYLIRNGTNKEYVVIKLLEISRNIDHGIGAFEKSLVIKSKSKYYIFRRLMEIRKYINFDEYDLIRVMGSKQYYKEQYDAYTQASKINS